MKTLMMVVLVLALCVVGLGFYRGWFVLSSQEAGSNKVDINLTVDRDKVTQDAESVKEKTSELGDN
ncbi:MAG TPA: hypothetical protein VGB99_02580 [Acidobacteriota bacterium]|jgi:uncharacterized membrane protein